MLPDSVIEELFDELQVYSHHMKFKMAHDFIDKLSIKKLDKNLLHEQVRVSETLREKYITLIQKVLEKR